MASIIEELISTLKEEDRVYDELLPIAKGKTRVIVDGDLKKLEEITEQEQLVIEKINALEKKRTAAVVDIGTVMSRNPSALTLTKIIELLKKQPEEARTLSTLHDSLTGKLKILSDLNRSNGELINHALEMVDFDLNLVQSTRMSPGTNNYTKNASQDGDSQIQTGSFDAKQ